MYRFWTLLLLALSLWPTPAPASTGAAGGGASIGAVQAGPYGGALRSPTGLELLERIESLRPDVRTRGSGAGPAHVPTAAAVAVRPIPAPAPRAAAGPSVPPLSERLPYDATAPPSPR